MTEQTNTTTQPQKTPRTGIKKRFGKSSNFKRRPQSTRPGGNRRPFAKKIAKVIKKISILIYFSQYSIHYHPYILEIFH